MTPPTTCDLLVIAASNGQNLQLAERFATAARARDQGAEVLDLTAIDLPLFTPRPRPPARHRPWPICRPA